MSKILLVTGHPAQVHVFRPLRDELLKRGHDVVWMATEKDISRYLLDYFEIPFIKLNRPGRGVASKAWRFLSNNWKAFCYLRKNRIDVVVSRVSPYVTVAAYLSRIRHIGISDTESAGIYDFVFCRFLTSFVTARSFRRNLRPDQIRFDGNLELCYLHPNRYVKRENGWDILGIQKKEKYIILRFVSWDAYHDKGLTGFSEENKLSAVERFSRYARVFISSEKELPDKLKGFKISIPPEKMHDVLADASLFFGESATMASESVVQGTPAIFLDENGRGYTDEEERYGLLWNYGSEASEQIAALLKGEELLAMDETFVNDYSCKHKKFLGDTIDVTDFFATLVEEPNQIFNGHKTGIGRE